MFPTFKLVADTLVDLGSMRSDDTVIGPHGLCIFEPMGVGHHLIRKWFFGMRRGERDVVLWMIILKSRDEKSISLDPRLKRAPHSSPTSRKRGMGYCVDGLNTIDLGGDDEIPIPLGGIEESVDDGDDFSTILHRQSPIGRQEIVLNVNDE